MRGTLSIAAAAGLTTGLALLCGPAAAASYQGDAAANTFVGTSGADRAFLRGGNDTVEPRAGADQIHLGAGNDEVILRADRSVDEIWCGPGIDTVVWLNSVPDPRDILHGCEEALRVLITP